MNLQLGNSFRFSIQKICVTCTRQVFVSEIKRRNGLFGKLFDEHDGSVVEEKCCDNNAAIQNSENVSKVLRECKGYKLTCPC